MPDLTFTPTYPGGRFCKTCRFLRADRAEPTAECVFWVEFAKTFPMPWAKIGAPARFGTMVIFPRHVWDDLPRNLALDGIDTSCVDGPWSEVMDCPQWLAKAGVVA